MHIGNDQIKQKSSLRAHFDIKRSALLISLLGAASLQVAVAQQASGDQSALLNALRAACQNDVQTLCSGVQAGGGRIINCLLQHKDSVSSQCKQAYMQAKQASQQQQNSGQSSQSQSSGGSWGQSQSTQSQSSTGSWGQAQPSQNQSSTGGWGQSQSSQAQSSGQTQSQSAEEQSDADSKGAAGSPRYFRMKRATIDDKGNNVPNAVSMLIPTTWQMQGSIRALGGLGGCFADLESISIHAQSADGSMVFEAQPDLTWQYADDQQTLRMMAQEGQAYAKGGIKPCPVIQPMRAADFLQKIIPKYYPDAHIVSVDAYPELDQLVRERLGISVKGSSNDGNVRTDAARARLEYQQNGKTIEQWVTVGVWMRAYPSGRGNVYDCHATMLNSFIAPKGQLDSNATLFRLMAFNISHDPQWDSHINGMIAQLYQQQQAQEAKRSQMIADFQKHVADTVNQVTQTAEAGANQAAFGEDQIARGVQTFRNPETGQTFELSNLHDHAWLSSDNTYVMSDDPNFNPNGQLDGSWTALEPVQAQP